ncbi:hypothetical protein JRO89_XS01G0014900 [Xanthoceras sorbifolium]|uniref:Uncharacterized protein n=1 Tax=Xanthoceras sorbifolium TaxID=99658 RepID=A0ABQ8IHS1_9ROSI|nr:hypothetical protein JRO89_XS01G0014900 [Xanthoceras sorbifolium]
MGCTASKLDNEDTVRRCKDRRRLMKEAVYARHHLAAAHADYCRSLRLTGAALCTFAAGEQLSVSDQTPAVFLHPPNPSPSPHIRVKPSPSPSLHEPPPPLFSPSPAPSMASSKPAPPPLPRIYNQNQNENLFHKNNKSSVVDEETEREEVQCSEWGDHYSTSTSSDDEEYEEEEMDKDSRSEMGSMGTRSNFGSVKQQQQQHQQPVYANFKKSDDAASSSASFRTREISDMKMVVRHKDLKEIVDALKENFDKAAAAGDQVADILEIGRAQLDRSFSQLKKTVYHSSSMLSTLSSSWTSKPPLAVKYRLDTGGLNEPGGPKSLCSTLDRLLAWEKKLYEEVKSREGVKIEHEKKLSSLQSQEYKGEDETKLDKTKTSITRLQSLIIVTSQAVSTTSTAIIGLRDSDLVPQLIDLCHGPQQYLTSTSLYHMVKILIIMLNVAKGDSTSELHRQATRDLESAVSAWHTSFCRLIKFQRDFMRSLHGWFKLTLIPVCNDNVDGTRESSESYAFCDEWKLALDRVPDTVASEAIKSFINVVHVISVKQSEELKIKKRTETASKELEKKASSLRNIERKFYHSYSMVGIGLPDSGSDSSHMLDARDPLAEKKSDLAACQRRVEDEMLRHSKAVEVTRAMTLNNIQTGLPGVFQALTSFSALFTESLSLVCNRAGFFLPVGFL